MKLFWNPKTCKRAEIVSQDGKYAVRLLSQTHEGLFYEEGEFVVEGKFKADGIAVSFINNEGAV